MNELTVLIVEDNEDDRFLTIRMIRKLPFSIGIEISRNGDEALRRILGAPGEEPGPLPSFLLLDLQLPKVGGIKILEKIREAADQKHLPVFILSSSGSPLDLAACSKLGISGYLPKPLDSSQLQEALSREGLI